MNSAEHEKLYKFEQFYWWHVGRRYILNSFLKKFLKDNKNQILEIGCGTGGNLPILKNWGRVVGLDCSELALKFCRERGFNDLVLGKAENTDFPDKFFDLVVALDVLEHIKDDEQALRESNRVLKEGGYLLATVPAYPFLWSEHDEALSHFRRYSVSDFCDKLQKSGFKIKKISYLVSFVFPLVFGYRILRKNFFPKSDKKNNTAYVVLPKFINRFFILLLEIEAFLLKYFNIPFGTSIICIAQK